MKDQHVGHYKIIEKLGAGGMGEVWLAEDTRLERKVALKFLPQFVESNEAERARFIHEAKAAARVSHPNVAQVHEIGEVEDRLFIVMEYVGGSSLRDRLTASKGKALPLEDVLEWARETAEGLSAAHRKKIVHRDIKPANLMFDEDGRVKITDFGLARLQTSTRLTATGATLGTAGFSSPEQIRGEEADHRSDLFSFGVTLYEALTGTSPFYRPDAQAVYFAVLTSTPELPSKLRSDLPEGIDKIIGRLLEKDPRERYQSADEVAEAIAILQQELGIAVRMVIPSVAIQRREILRKIANSRAISVISGILILAATTWLLWLYPRPSLGEGFWVSRDEWPVQLAILPPEVSSADTTAVTIAESLENQLVEILDAFIPVSTSRGIEGAGRSRLELSSRIMEVDDNITLTAVVRDSPTDRKVFDKNYTVAKSTTIMRTIESLSAQLIRDVLIGIGMPLMEGWEPKWGAFQPQSDRVTLLNNRVRRYLTEGLPELAEQELRGALEDGIREPSLYYSLGQSLEVQQRWAEAADLYGQVSRITIIDGP